MLVYSGTSGFGYKEWKGGFYPIKLPDKNMLAYYSGKLGTVEINNTFYRMPTATVLSAWANQVPEDFKFALKAPQMITHIKRLHNVNDEMRFFTGSVSVLKSRLGCVLFQFPASFKQDIRLLNGFLKLIPAKVPCAFDFRSATWLNEATYGPLRKRGFSLGLEDTDEKHLQKLEGGLDWGYLRMREDNYTAQELRKWAKRIESQKWDRAFVFFKHEDDTASVAPELALKFSGMFGKVKSEKSKPKSKMYY